MTKRIASRTVVKLRLPAMLLVRGKGGAGSQLTSASWFRSNVERSAIEFPHSIASTARDLDWHHFRGKAIEDPIGDPASVVRIAKARLVAGLFKPFEKIGAPSRIRTHDPQIRSLVLYPTELPAPLGAAEPSRGGLKALT